MSLTVSVGAYLSSSHLRLSYFRDDRLFSLDEIPLAETGRNIYWVQLDPSSLDYFTALDLVGVEVGELPDPRATIRDSLRHGVTQLGKQGLHVEKICLAFPSVFDEATRDHLLASLGDGLPPVGLIDVSSAAMYGYKAQQPDTEGVFVVAVDGPASLEVALFDVGSGRLVPRGLESVAALSERSLDRFLLQSVLEQLPDVARNGLATVDPNAALSSLLERISSSKSLLSRTSDVRCPLQEGGLKGITVTLRREDFDKFVKENTLVLREALETLLRRANLSSADVKHTLAIGRLAEHAEIRGTIQRMVGEVELLPTSVVVDGAALAARNVRTNGRPRQRPSLVPLRRFAKRHDQMIKLPTPPQATAIDPAQATTWETAARSLIQAGELDQARNYLVDVVRRAESLLASIPAAAGANVSQAATPTGKPSEVKPPKNVRLEQAEKILEQAKQMLQHSRNMLASGGGNAGVKQQAIEIIKQAVGYSHLADKEAEPVPINEKHHVLVAVVDIHCEAADQLQDPEDFDLAMEKLGCAQTHRRNDERVREKMAERYLQRALYLESEKRVPEAMDMLRMAAKFAMDDTEIYEHLDRLEGVAG